MTLYFVAEANNYSYDIQMSDPFTNKSEALKFLRKQYRNIIKNVGEGNIEEAGMTEDGYQILTFGGDLYYGQFHEVVLLSEKEKKKQ